MFMVTRDPDAAFTPDLCSRVTFVNFTVTPEGLRNQLLDACLRALRPEHHARRAELAVVRAECRVGRKHSKGRARAPPSEGDQYKGGEDAHHEALVNGAVRDPVERNRAGGAGGSRVDIPAISETVDQ